MLPAPTASRLPAVLLVAASLSLSALAVVRDPLLDGAAIATLVAAGAIGSDWAAALQQPLAWPLHAVLVAVLHAASGLSLPASTRLLDAVLFAVLALGFARLVARLGSEQRFFGWAALVLLLLPALNAQRGAALSDAGYWAFLVAATAVLARYHARPGWPDAFRWALLAMLAALFRAEAMLYALVLPLACLRRDPFDARAGGVLRLYAALGTVSLLPLLIAARLGELPALADRVLPALLGLLPGVVQGFGAASTRLAEQVLHHSGAALASLALAAALLAVLAAALLKTLGLAGTALLGWAVATRRALLPDGGTRAIAQVFALTGLLIAAARIATTQTIDTRSLMPLALALLIPAAFAARELLGAANAARHPALARGALGILLVALLAQGFVRIGARTDYLSECIGWMEANLPEDARVFSNDSQLAWYSGRQVDWRAVAAADASIIAREAPLAEVDYWVVHLDGRDARLDSALIAYADVLAPLARFADGDGRQVVVLARAQ